LVEIFRGDPLRYLVWPHRLTHINLTLHTLWQGCWG